MLRLSWDRERLEVRASQAPRRGRGAYLCAKMDCWERARHRGVWRRALRLGETPVDQRVLEDTVTGMISDSSASSIPA